MGIYITFKCVLHLFVGILSLTAPFKVAALITIFLMGLFAFMNVPGLQVSVVMLAERFVPSAVEVASAINIAIFNAGIVIGAFMGGFITDSIGLIHTGWVGAFMVAGAARISTVMASTLAIRWEK